MAGPWVTLHVPCPPAREGAVDPGPPECAGRRRTSRCCRPGLPVRPPCTNHRWVHPVVVGIGAVGRGAEQRHRRGAEQGGDRRDQERRGIARHRRDRGSRHGHSGQYGGGELAADRAAHRTGALVIQQAETIARQAETIVHLEATVERLTARVAELERRLGRNSGNSSLPPSSDSFARLTPARSASFTAGSIPAIG